MTEIDHVYYLEINIQDVIKDYNTAQKWNEEFDKNSILVAKKPLKYAKIVAIKQTHRETTLYFYEKKTKTGEKKAEKY